MGRRNRAGLHDHLPTLSCRKIWRGAIKPINSTKMNVIEAAAKQSSATKVFSTISRLLPTLGGWTSISKGHTFAALVLGYRPEVCVEIGVWEGRGSLSIALALQEIGRGMLYSIDAWDAKVSVEGQTHPGDIAHWGKSDHE